MTKRSNSPLFGNSDATSRPYQVSNDWVFDICEALSHIHKNVKLRKFFASPEKLVKCSYNSFALTPRIVVSYKRKYVHKVLVNCFVKLAKEKCVVQVH